MGLTREKNSCPQIGTARFTGVAAASFEPQAAMGHSGHQTLQVPSWAWSRSREGQEIGEGTGAQAGRAGNVHPGEEKLVWTPHSTWEPERDPSPGAAVMGQGAMGST